MLKDTKSLGNNKAPACESRGFVRKKKEVRILTHLLEREGYGCDKGVGLGVERQFVGVFHRAGNNSDLGEGTCGG